MARTPSNMIELNSKAPDFELLDVISDKNVSLSDIKSDKANLIMFICNHCPFVKHIEDKLAQVTNDLISKGITVIAINSNDVDNYPEDSPEKMITTAKENGYSFPYLFDETQEVAKLYDAACTPDFFVYDGNLELKYRGQFDDSRPGNDEPITGKDLTNAVDSILGGKEPDSEQKPSIGCNIKWK